MNFMKLFIMAAICASNAYSTEAETHLTNTAPTEKMDLSRLQQSFEVDASSFLGESGLFSAKYFSTDSGEVCDFSDIITPSNQSTSLAELAKYIRDINVFIYSTISQINSSCVVDNSGEHFDNIHFDYKGKTFKLQAQSKEAFLGWQYLATAKRKVLDRDYRFIVGNFPSEYRPLFQIQIGDIQDYN